MKTTVIGIDYSLTSPCVCVSKDKTFSNSYFYFLNDRKSVVGKHHNILGNFHDDYMVDQERYENLANWVLEILLNFDKSNTVVMIEDYSFGSKGRIFNIAENCGLLKYLLYKNKFSYQTIQPTVIKKYATGKGNANKQLMYDAFYKEHQVDLIDVYSKKGKLDSPVTDIVDSYYLKNYTIDNIGTFNTKPKKEPKQEKNENGRITK